jgi:uncharacterized protein YraI
MKTLRTRVCQARLTGFLFAALLAVSVMAPAQVGAHDGHEQSNEIANAGGENVRLRSGPSPLDSEIARFPEGTAVAIVDGPHPADDGGIWYQVNVGKQTGYMDSAFLVAVEVAHVGSGSSGVVSGTATATDPVFLRLGPSTADASIATLAPGETVTLTGASRDGWNSVSANVGDGWVFAEFLDFGTSVQGTRYTIESAHLRSGPGTSFSSLATMQVGVQLEMTGTEEDGFVEVMSPFGEGWVFAQFIDASVPDQPVQVEQPAPGAPVASGARFTLNEVHLRSGPATSFDSIAIMEPGVQLEMTGGQEGEFVEVMAPSGAGWVSAQFIGATAPDVPDAQAQSVPEAPAAVEVEVPAATEARFANANVNLRSSPSQAAAAIVVIASGTEIAFAGESENGFSRVSTTAGAGWIASKFLSEAPPEAPAAPAATNDLIAWPVAGGEWFISQGYNGSSHQNRTQHWQYYYSLDLKRSDGATANQPIYAPVTGTVRWIDEATGGMSIYMGNGLAYAMFHANFDPSIQEGDVLTQGQYMGVVSPPGQGANGGNPHLHITVWSTTDEGNWSRNAIPFTGNVAIAGIEFPETGTGNDHRGYAFNP